MLKKIVRWVKMRTRFYFENIKIKKKQLGELGIYGRIILNRS
jgi:hypothetical protein